MYTLQEKILCSILFYFLCKQVKLGQTGKIRSVIGLEPRTCDIYIVTRIPTAPLPDYSSMWIAVEFTQVMVSSPMKVLPVARNSLVYIGLIYFPLGLVSSLILAFKYWMSLLWDIGYRLCLCHRLPPLFYFFISLKIITLFTKNKLFLSLYTNCLKYYIKILIVRNITLTFLEKKYFDDFFSEIWHGNFGVV